MSATATEVTACLCGCGETPNKGRRWMRGHAVRGEGGYRPPASTPPRTVRAVRLPTPAELDGMTEGDWDDLVAAQGGGPDWAEPEDELGAPGRSGSVVTEDIPPGAQDGTDDLSDAPPAHGAKDWARESRMPPPRVTAAIRRDVQAKIAIPLTIGGALWEARDPMCGGAFNGQRSALAADLTALAVDSPFWLQFFTGPAGGYMRYVQLAADLWPVVEMILAHHVLHRAERAAGPPDATTPPQPDYARYPA